jgi:uncharacterized membrane protein
MIYRMSAALLSLAGLFVSGYLYLYKIGRIGSLACGTGACEAVQLSSWSQVAGLEVALVGVLGYTGLVVLSLISIQPSAEERLGTMRLIAFAAGIGVLFTAYLTYLELFVLHAICRWCVASAVIIVAIFVLAMLDLRRLSRTRVS